ncbi:MAG: RNA polymerase sigma-70 factor [Cyanobacteria bacterium P01_A01_bin.40]
MITTAKNDSIDWLEEFNQHRSLLFAIAYRMLGSVMDAEDMVQETFLRWQQTSRQNVKSVKAYLTKITTRLCIDRLRSAQVRREQYVGSWLPEPIVTKLATEPAKTVELADSLKIAFLVLLEQLSPLERAVFLLREAFGYEYSEISQIVEKKPANCRQIARRARKHLADRRSSRFPTSLQQQELLTSKFIAASQQGDLQGLLDLLVENITLWNDGGGKVQACLKPLHGAAKVAGFLRAIYRRSQKLGLKYELELVWVNGQPGVIYTSNGKLENVVAIDIVNDRIHSLYFIRNPDKLKQVFSQDIAEMALDNLHHL